MPDTTADPFADPADSAAEPNDTADILGTMVRLPAEPGYYVVCSAGSSYSRTFAHVFRIRKWDRGLMAAFKNGTWDKDQHWGKNAHVVLGPCRTDIEAHHALVGQAAAITAALPDAVVDVDSLDLDYVPLLKWATKNTFAHHANTVTE